MSIEDRLQELGIVLPKANPPAAIYCPGIQVGKLVFTAGQTPKVDGKLQYTGKLGQDLTVEEGQMAAQLCILSCLAILKDTAGSLDHVKRIVKLTGFVNATPSFTQHSQVIDGASKLLYDIFGSVGSHARSAVGCVSLPGNACCEIEMVAAVK